MRVLANDSSIVIKKADMGLCVVSWDYYKRQKGMRRFIKILILRIKFSKSCQIIVINYLKVLRQKGVLLKRNLRTLLLNLKRPQIQASCIYYLNLISVWKMFQVGHLFQTASLLQKKFRSF